METGQIFTIFFGICVSIMLLVYILTRKAAKTNKKEIEITKLKVAILSYFRNNQTQCHCSFSQTPLELLDTFKNSDLDDVKEALSRLEMDGLIVCHYNCYYLKGNQPQI